MKTWGAEYSFGYVAAFLILHDFMSGAIAQWVGLGSLRGCNDG
jgi:hypothetical protein